MLSYYTLGALIAFDEELQQTAVTPVITEVMFFVTTALRIAGDIITHTHAHGCLNASVKLCHACFNSLFRLQVMQQTRMFPLSQVAFIFTVNNTKQLHMNKTGVM